MVAIWLPVLALFVSFAVDFAHFFDYNRNLQNRADASVLAASVEYGTTCFGSPTSAQLADIGHTAQQYAGPPSGTPDNPNLPYPFTSSTPYRNQPNLTAGSGNDFFLVVNGATSYDKGGRNFTDGTFCSTDYTSPASAAVDVWLTQEHLPLFFPLLGFRPTISTHARATLEGEASSPSVPIAVGDTGFTPCVTVFFRNSQDNSLLGTAVLHEEPNSNPSATNPFVWDNSVVQLDANGNPIPNTGPTAVRMPTGANVYTQVFLNNCSGSGEFYDGTNTGTGISYVNSHPAAAPAVGTGDSPKLTCSTPADCTRTGAGGAGGVFLQNGTCTPDQYFSTGSDCGPIVNAYVKFDPGINQSKTKVFFIDKQWDPTANGGTGGFVAQGNPTLLTQDNTDPTHWFSKNNPQLLTLGQASGVHQIEITWEQDASDTSSGPMSTCSNSNPCTGSFGVQAGTFGACNGCDQPDDSGPIILSQLRLASDPATTIGENTLPAGTTQNLVVTIELGGLYAQKPGDQPPTVLRFPVSGNHQTGLIDCGQGNGKDAETVYYGCGPQNPKFNPPLNPLYVYSRPPNSDCSPATDGDTTDWPGGNHQDCVNTTPGTRRQNVICPLVDRIVGAPFGTNCNNQSSGACPKNNWISGNKIDPGDPRAITMIITSPVDLASGINDPQLWIPIRKFATFYITGWDSQIKPQCSDNEPYPAKGKLKNNQNAAVWGHWMNYLDTSGTPNGQTCDVNSVTAINCVPALTR
jgi:hypothetical protein